MAFEAFSIVGKIAVEGSEQVKQQLEKVGVSAEQVQKGLKAVGAAFTAAGAAGLKMVSDARQLNAQLGSTAVTLGVSTKEMRDLTLATTNVTFPIKSVTATFDLLTRAGMRNTEEMVNAANAFDALGDATGSSAETVADILIPALKAMGEDIPQTSAELDKFTWLVKNTTTDLSEFGSVMNYVAMYGDGLNVSLDDMVAIMAALEAQGKGGATATRLFRTAVNQAKDGSVSLTDALGLTTEEIAYYRGEMEAATGITDEHASVMNEEYGLMDKIKQKWSELTLAAGSFLTPLEPILGLMTALGPAMLFFSTSTGLATVKTIAHTTAIIAKTVAVKAVTAAQWLWNAAMTANPIGIVIAAIGALVAAIVFLVKNWDTVREKTVEVWNNIVDFLKGVWDNIVGFFKDNWDKILAILFPAIGLPILIARNWDAIVDNVKDIWNRVVDWFRGIPPKIGEIFATVKDWILSPFRAAWHGIEQGINWLITMLNKINFSLPDWIPGIGGKSFGINIPEVSLPSFAGYEGVVPGPRGTPYLATVHGGETMISQGNIANQIAQAVRDGLANIQVPVLVEVGGEQVAAVVSRQQYRMKQVRR